MTASLERFYCHLEPILTNRASQETADLENEELQVHTEWQGVRDGKFIRFSARMQMGADDFVRCTLVTDSFASSEVYLEISNEDTDNSPLIYPLLDLLSDGLYHNRRRETEYRWTSTINHIDDTHSLYILSRVYNGTDDASRPKGVPQERVKKFAQALLGISLGYVSLEPLPVDWSQKTRNPGAFNYGH